MTNYHPLPKPSSKIDRYHEIASVYADGVNDFYNNLSPSERIFCYYMYRACLPGNHIAADQLHRDSVAIHELVELLIASEDQVKTAGIFSTSETEKFFKELKIYAVYLWTNHAQYFVKEHKNEKRTPGKLGLETISQKNLQSVLIGLKRNDLATLIDRIAPSIFDLHDESTICEANSIEGSAVNFYSPDFTENDYQALSSEEKSYLNAHYGIIHTEQGERRIDIQKYGIGKRYSSELAVASYWLTRAVEHAEKNPSYFDKNVAQSIRDMIKFLHSGDEKEFRTHSISWLKTDSRIDYVFGFIENYEDPKEYRGMFQAEVTIKTLDMKKINALLPLLEAKLPFNDRFKRENLEAGQGMPNASMNAQLFASGMLGPLSMTAAYCLPNYEDIRAEYGSKQVIYQAERGLGALINPEASLQLFYLESQIEFLKLNDPEMQLHNDIWNVHCILHETLGHGSGRLAEHTFVSGDLMTVDGATYQEGDTITLTSENSVQFFAGTSQSLEEFRAEIIALYTSVFMFDELASVGVFKQWPEKIGKEKLIEWMIYDMAGTGLRRLQSQPLGINEISGSHAQANSLIMNYLIDNGAIRLVEEKREFGGVTYTVLDFEIISMDRAREVIKELAIEAQRIKSTADGQSFIRLLELYGKYVRSAEYPRYLQDAMKAVMGDLKMRTTIYPDFTPLYDAQGVTVDVNASWPTSFVEQQMDQKKIALSIE